LFIEIAFIFWGVITILDCSRSCEEDGLRDGNGCNDKLSFWHPHSPFAYSYRAMPLLNSLINQQSLKVIACKVLLGADMSVYYA
jgi:hypothetical protein